MPQIFGNNAASTLSSVLAIGGTTAFVQTGHGSRFPVVSGLDFAYCSLEDSAGNIEIVKVTAHTSGSTSLTILRGQQGTAARTWASGDLIELRMTAAEATRWEAVATASAISPGAPADVTGFAMTASINGGILRWDANGETNVRNYELRRGGTDWNTASPLYGGAETLIGGTAHVWLPPSAGSYTIRIKATNNEGVQSDNAVSATATLLGPEILNNAVYVQYADPVASPGGVTDGATWIQTDSGGVVVVMSKLRVGGAWVLSVRDIQGNAATATTAASCSGNAATASYAASSGTAAACSGNAATATTVSWAGVSGKPSAISYFSNDAGYITSSGTSAACSGNAATATTAASCSGNAATATTAGYITNSAYNGYGTRTVSTGAPSGGSDGDVWYVY